MAAVFLVGALGCGRPMARGAPTTPTRLAGLRSGTHGGARARARQHHQHTRLPRLRSGTSPHRHSTTTVLPDSDSLVVPDSDPVPTVGRGPGRGNTTNTLVFPDSDRGPHHTAIPPQPSCRTQAHSSCRTPIRYPRWGAGQGAAIPPTHSSSPTPIGDLTTPPFHHNRLAGLRLTRRAGLRSGTHGGARARARQLTRRHFVIRQGLLRHPLRLAPLLPANPCR